MRWTYRHLFVMLVALPRLFHCSLFGIITRLKEKISTTISDKIVEFSCQHPGLNLALIHNEVPYRNKNRRQN